MALYASAQAPHCAWVRALAYRVSLCARVAWRPASSASPAAATPASDHSEERLYEDHIRTNCFQKAILSAGSAVGALFEPRRDDLVAVLGETTGTPALRALRKRMAADPVGQRILAERPRVRGGSFDPVAFSSYPAGSFGAAYGKFMGSHGFHADERARVRFVDDEELAYIMQRYREIHDYTHVLLGVEPTVVGEIAVKWFELVQTGLPMCALSAIVGPVRLPAPERDYLFRTLVPKAVASAKQSANLMCVFFEECFEEPIDKLRSDLGIHTLE